MQMKGVGKQRGTDLCDGRTATRKFSSSLSAYVKTFEASHVEPTNHPCQSIKCKIDRAGISLKQNYRYIHVRMVCGGSLKVEGGVWWVTCSGVVF